MRKLTTILCSMAFMISGFLITFMKSEPQNQLHAAPVAPLFITKEALPLDLQSGLAKNDKSIVPKDTVILRDTVHVVKYRTKYRAPKKMVRPDSIPSPARSDTLYVPELRVIIQTSKDVLVDTTFTIKPVNSGCPELQPLRASEE